MPNTKERVQTRSATIVRYDELTPVRRPIPASWKKAAGLMRHKRKSLERHIATVRQEWDRGTR